MLAVYVSGHGYGHATRSAEVLRAVRARAPGLPIGVASSVPASIFEAAVAPPLEVRRLECDVGLVQRDALVIDEPATAAAWRAFMVGWERQVAGEARWLADAGARLVLGDIPPLAFAAAARAGVRSVALGNFSWDWIYRHLAARQPALAEAAEWAAAAYAEASLLLRLPFAGEMGAFPRVVDLPFVARRPRLSRGAARRRLGLDERPAVLLSFGGAGVPGLRASAFAGLDGYQLLLSATRAEPPRELPAGLRRLDDAALEAAGVGYPDLIGAVDVVVTKPGYGIVSDCLGARTRLVYTDRGDFPEYPVMVAEMGRYLPCVYATNEEIRCGRIGRALGQVLAQAWPARCDLSGAEQAAGRLLETLAGR